jgi:hypothetical protein
MENKKTHQSRARTVEVEGAEDRLIIFLWRERVWVFRGRVDRSVCFTPDFSPFIPVSSRNGRDAYGKTVSNGDSLGNGEPLRF